MTKKLVAIPEGNLLRIAATKGVATLSALKEKTGVDRKTLRTINTGQPVKETTLQAIADKLRVPLAHLLGPSTLDEVENSSSLAPYHRVSSAGIIFARSSCSNSTPPRCAGLPAKPIRLLGS